MSYRPKIKSNASGTLTDLPLDAESVKGGTLHTTMSASDNTNFSTDKAIATYITNQGFGKGTVKKVNNTSPDANGNVSLTIPQGTVTSVRVQAGTGLSSSTSTAQSTSLDTTISIASGYKLPTTTEWNAKGVGTVKSVNNVSPDSNGNVTISAGTGTVTSVALANDTNGGLTVSSGSPVTTSGTIKLKHSNILSASGTIGSSSASSGATLSVPYANYDINGHITSKGTHTHTINNLTSSAINSSYKLPTSAEGNFLTSEYNKTLNLYGHLIDNGHNEICFPMENLENGKTYTVSSDTSRLFKCSVRPGDASSVFEYTGTSYTFTKTSAMNGNNLYIYDTSTWDLVNENIMLNEGNVAYPYQEYNGATAHQKDLEGVLLWQNANPLNGMGETYIYPLSMANYKYIVIGYTIDNNGDKATIYQKVKHDGSYFQIANMINGTQNVYTREFQFVNDTSIRVLYGKYNGNNLTSVIIPTEIYGTNTL